jgi:hypothetical protein
MTESSIVVWTWKDPGGGAGNSEQKLVMYLSMGSVRTCLMIFEEDLTVVETIFPPPPLFVLPL